MPGIQCSAVGKLSHPDANRLSDEQVVARILRGHGREFEILVRRHQDALYSFILRMVRDREEALDLCQEVFLKVFNNLERFDPRFRFTTWLYRIASNASIDQLRRRRPGTVLSLDAPLRGESGSVREFPSKEPTPDQFLQAQETHGHLERALQDLPEGYRRILLLRHRSHRRYDEIARITGLPLGTVKNRIFRAREMLRRAIPS
ncbi:MAG: RNA polymerase sigma factor [Acidobacteriota bacterium]